MKHPFVNYQGYQESQRVGPESGVTDLTLIRFAYSACPDLEMSLSAPWTFSKQIFLWSKLNLKTSNTLSRPQGAVDSQVRENWAHTGPGVLEAKLYQALVLPAPSCLIWTNLPPSRGSQLTH